MQPEMTRQRLMAVAQDHRPSAIEFEMAYQARVAIDRIRFAIKHTEQIGRHLDQGREVCLQLLDALERLQALDRHFQARSQIGRLKRNGRETET